MIHSNGFLTDRFLHIAGIPGSLVALTGVRGNKSIDFYYLGLSKNW